MKHELRTWWTYLGLTLASALLGHLIFDALDDGIVILWSRPVHLVYAAVVAIACLGAMLDVYGHRPSERRRRIALMHSVLGRNRPPVAASLAAQACLAWVTLQLEGSIADRSCLILAVACALASLLVGAIVIRKCEAAILRLALAAPLARRLLKPSHREPGLRRAPLLGPQREYALFRPNRPPPAFA